MYKITDFGSDEDKVLCDWYQYSSDHLKAAKYLLISDDFLSFLDSAAILCHYAFELLFKMCMLYKFKELADIHELIDLIKDNNGHTVDLQYDANGFLETIVSSDGKSIEIEYNEEDYISKVITPYGREYNYTYSESGDLIRVI